MLKETKYLRGLVSTTPIRRIGGQVVRKISDLTFMPIDVYSNCNDYSETKVFFIPSSSKSENSLVSLPNSRSLK